MLKWVCSVKPEDPTGNCIISREGLWDAFTIRNEPLRGKPASLKSVVILLCRPGLTVGKTVAELGLLIAVGIMRLQNNRGGAQLPEVR